MQFPKRIDSRLLDRNVQKSVLLDSGLRCWVYPTEYAALFAMCTHDAESWNTNLLQLIFARGGITVSPNGAAEYMLSTEKSEHYRNCADADSNMHGLPWRCGEIQYGYKIPESEHYKGPSGWCFVPALALHNFLLDKSEMRNFISLTRAADRAREEIKKLYATHGMVHWFEHDPVDHGRTLTMAVRVEDALRAITPNVLTQAHKMLETEWWRIGGCVAIERALTSSIGRALPAARTISAVRLALNWVCGQWNPEAERGGYPLRVEVGQYAEQSNEKQYRHALKIGNQYHAMVPFDKALNTREAQDFYDAYTAKRMELWDYITKAIGAAHAANAEATETVGKLPTETVGKLPTETVGKLPTETVGKLPTETVGKLPTETAGQSEE